MPLPRWKPRSGLGRAAFGVVDAAVGLGLLINPITWPFVAMAVADRLKSKKAGGEREDGKQSRPEGQPQAGRAQREP